MHMSLESTPVAWEAPKSLPKSTPLPWIQRQLRTGLLLACAATQGLAKAEEPPFIAAPLFKQEWLDLDRKKVLPVGESVPVPEPPLIAEWLEEPKNIKEFEQSIRLNIELLTNPSCPIREGAMERLITIIPEAMKLQNPLPSDIMEMLQPDIKDQRIPLERRVRLLRRIWPKIEEQIQSLPGRISSPEKANKTLHEVLEEQFGMKIETTDADVQQQLRFICDNLEGELSSSALVKLCEQTGCVPLFQGEKIVLRKAQKGEAVWHSGKTCFVRKMKRECELDPGTEEIEAFHTPDCSVLLETQHEIDWEIPRIGIVNHQNRMPLDMTQECIYKPKFELPADRRAVSAYVGILPVTKNIVVGQRGNSTFGMFKMNCDKTTRLENGEWETNIGGGLYDDHTTFCSTIYKQLLSTARVQPVDHEGNVIDKQSIALYFSGDVLCIRVVTKTQPHHFQIRAFQDVCTEEIEILPK